MAAWSASLSTSVQDTDSDVSLINLEESKISERDTDSDVSLINLKEMKRYQPLLGEKGYNFVEVNDQLLAISDPQGRAVNLGMSQMNLGMSRMTLEPRKEGNFRAWLSADSVQTNNVLQDELDEPNDVGDPSLLEEAQPKCDLERNNLQDGERCAKAVGITKTRKDYSPKEQALMKKAFIQYTVCLEEILLSDGVRWSFVVFDIVKIIFDLMSWLAGLHAKFIVYGDVRAGNIFINDYMKAFLISSDKSKEQNNETALREESIIDVKAMCKVMGGLCNFYTRMNPCDTQNSKKAEEALFALLRRGYRDGITAKDFLEVLGRIVVDDQVSEQEEAPQEEAPQEEAPQEEARQLPVKKIPELGSAAVNNQGLPMISHGSEPRPEAISNKLPLQASRDTNNGIESMDKTSEVESRAMVDHCSTDGTTTHADRVSEQKKAGAVTDKISDLGSAVVNSQGSEQVPEAHVSNQVPLLASGATNNEGPENESRDTTGELDSREMEDGYSTDGASIHEMLMADMEMEMFQSN